MFSELLQTRAGILVESQGVHAPRLAAFVVIPAEVAVSQGLLVVIPDEDAPGGRDPESRKCLPFLLLLDPPAGKTGRGMTEYDTASEAESRDGGTPRTKYPVSRTGQAKSGWGKQGMTFNTPQLVGGYFVELFP